MHFLHMLNKGVYLSGMGRILEEQVRLDHNDLVQQSFSQEFYFIEGDDGFEFVCYLIY